MSNERVSDEYRKILAWRIGVAILLLGLWEAIGCLIYGTWISQPTLILNRLGDWAVGTLPLHISTTIIEMVFGFGIGVPGGIVVGLLLGRSPLLGALFRPIIVLFYSVPLIALAPLLILFFGLDMEPKIVLVAVITFFLLFFNTFSGVQAVDKDLIAIFQLMGANRREQFQKVIAPACTAWILAGFKIALPYSLVAATVGEMLMARRGLGFLLTRAAGQFDMTGVYTILVILMVIGILIAEAVTRLEGWLLRWRSPTA